VVDYPAPHRIGPVGAPSVVALHGFAQNSRCWGPLANELAHAHRVTLPDTPGHGDAADSSDMDCPAGADALATACGAGAWLGYSMGGRLALHVAIAHPTKVDSLVLIGGTAGIEDAAARAERAAVDVARAERLEDVGIVAFMDEWLAMDMFSGLPIWARFDDERATNTVTGLCGSLRHAGTGSMTPVWDRLAALTMPVLCLAGERDPSFVAIAGRLAEEIGDNATVSVVADAGHALHLEQPERTAQIVLTFLDGVR